MKSRLLPLISALLGIALFIYVLRQTGVGEIWANVQKLGAGFLLILAISSLRYMSRTAAWMRCVQPEERSLGFWTFFRARVAGEAIGDLTFGPVLADPMRMLVLGNRMSLSSSVSSLMIENIAYTNASFFLIITGVAALMANFAMDGTVRFALMATIGLAFMLSAIGIVSIAKRWKVSSGTAAWLVRLAVRDEAKRAKLDGHIDPLRKVEDNVFDFYSQRPGDFLLVGLCELAFHCGGILEIFTTLRLLGLEIGIVTAFMLEAVNRAVNIAFLFVPGLVGVDEMLTKLMTETLQLGGLTGVTLAIVRKIRMFVWIAIGLVFLALVQRPTAEASEKELS